MFNFYICQGSSRLGISIGKFFIKLPFTFYRKVGLRGWFYRLLNGLKANINELEYKKCPDAFINFGIILNTPIIGNRFGFVNIYYKADKIDNISLIPKILPSIIEYKTSSFGYLKNKLVCIDYA